MHGEHAGGRLSPAAWALFGALTLLTASVVTGTAPAAVASVVLVVTAVAVFHRTILQWHVLLGTILLVVLFVPIRRYTLSAGLPIDLELYRVIVAAVILLWLLSLVVDPKVELRASPFDRPLLLVVVAVLLSELANPSRVQTTGPHVVKFLTFLVSFLLVYYFAVSVVRTKRHLDIALGLLVAGCAVVAIAGVLERRTGYNVFYHLGDWFPFLQFHGGDVVTRGGRLRVFASSEHPIALGALFAMLMPIGFALGYRSSRLWWIPTALLAVGVAATASRTPVMMLVVAGAVLLWLKPAETKRLWPLAVPAVVVFQIAVPGAIGTVRDAFFPPGGLVEEQARLPQNANPLLAGGRVRLLGPELSEWTHTPFFGDGYGTRITGFDEPDRNAPILDDQWLGTLLELGIVGIVAFIWLLIGSVRRLGRAAKQSDDDDGWLFAGFASAIAAFACGMFTYDAFSFVQVTFVFWILLGLAAAGLLIRQEEDAARIEEVTRGRERGGGDQRSRTPARRRQAEPAPATPS